MPKYKNNIIKRLLFLMCEKNRKGYCLTKNGNIIDTYKKQENEIGLNYIQASENIESNNENNIRDINFDGQNKGKNIDLDIGDNRINLY